MATIRWCPIYPKWDSYQPLFLLELISYGISKTRLFMSSHMSHMSIDVVISTHFFWLFSKLTWTLYPVSLALLPFWESRFPCLWVRTPFPSGVVLVAYRCKLSLLVFVSLLRSLILLWWNHHFAWLHKSEFDASIHIYSNHSKGYTKNPSIQSTCSLHLQFLGCFSCILLFLHLRASQLCSYW